MLEHVIYFDLFILAVAEFINGQRMTQLFQCRSYIYYKLMQQLVVEMQFLSRLMLDQNRG